MSLRTKIKHFASDKEKLSVLENIGSLSLLRIADFILPLLVLPYLISILGVEKYGLTVFALSLVTYFLNVTQFGFSLSAVRELSLNREDAIKVSQIFSAVMYVKLLLLITSFLLLSIIISSFSRFGDERLLYFYSFGMVIGDVLFPRWFFQGMEKMKFITLFNVFFKVLFTILVFVFIKEKEDYVLVPLLQSIGFICGGIFSLFIIFKSFKINLIKFNIVDIKLQFKNSFSSFVTLIIPTLYSNSSVFLLGIFTNNLCVGYFSGAVKICNAFSSLNKILTSALYPFVNRKKGSIALVNKWILIFGLFASFLMLISSKLSVLLLLGNDMLDVVPLVMILSISPFLLSVRTAYGINCLLIKGKDLLYMKIAIFSSVCGLCSAFCFIPLYSIYAAASVVIFSQFLYASLSFYYAKKF